ncbi:hypothetical protein PVAND_004692 [Polypedilum vanderplanki]|uniref:Uncharacterized protein n=1 Tax=Polypedilum vanderplanki TaxID=319348 RepID=A0A9J6BYV4_POLVA|nr:hypothetical protein PVAND_004692 [Polypedilum vanderplanki]
MHAVEVRNAYKYYGKAKDPKIVLNKLNMTVSPGSIYGLMGASGCGKTTLLSCIIGMIGLDGGEITALGHKTKANEIQKAGHRIGYMPQETALIGELTIKETIYYFGKIFQMPMNKLRERYDMLHKLLELPRDDHRVEDCSGGQMRRVSFAAAMIHEPDLLILDEPTVGLDPILREKIWNFMLNVTRTSKLSIIITTHYIDEAKQADCCGLMRNGILLAEDTPTNIISRHEVDNLEEAFLKLCMRRGASEDAVQNDAIQGNESSSRNIERMDNLEMIERPHENKSATTNSINHNNNIQNQNHTTSQEQQQQPQLFKRKKYAWSTIRALFTKNYLQMKRQPAGVTFMVIVPILQIIFFYLAIGGNPIGLKFGVVDDEVNYNDCFNSSLITTIAHDDSCDLHKISCRFIHEFDDSVAIKQHYKTFDEAFHDAKRGKIIGFMYFASNFTESLDTVQREGRDADDGSADNSRIQIYMDQSDLQLTFFLQSKFYQIFKNFTQHMMADCNLPLKLGNVPVNFEKPIYGSYDTDFKHSMAPPMIMVMMFYIAAGLTVAIFIADRKEGFWNRTLLAGVTLKEMMLVHILTHSVVLILQLLETIFLIAFVFGAENKGSNIAVLFMLMMLAYSGMFFGMLLSVECNDLREANFVLTGIATPMVVLAGMFWPLQGMPMFLQYVSYCMPFTLPSIAVRNIMMKGYSFFDPSVLIAAAIVTGWAFFAILLGLQGLKRKKYSRNT